MNNWSVNITARVIAAMVMITMTIGIRIIQASVWLMGYGVRVFDDMRKVADTKTLHDDIYRYVNVATSVVAVIITAIAMLRFDLSETWDRLIFVSAAGSAFMVLILLSVQRLRDVSAMPALKPFYWYTKHGVLISVAITTLFWWFSFQEEKIRFRLDYLGFPWYVFALSLVVMWGVNHLLLNRMPRMLHIGVQLVSVLVLIGAIFTAFVPINVSHNMYVINEMLAPVSAVVDFYSFIPQYTALYSIVIDVLMFIGITRDAYMTMDIIYLLLQSLVLFVVYLAVRMNYTNMVVPRWSTAIIFSIPPILFATSPWWEVLSVKSYYSMNMFSYSLVPNRSLVVFLVGSVGIWVISRIQLKATIGSQLLAIYGVSAIAMLGLYNNSDFGTFAAMGVGAAIVCYPFVTLANRIVLTVVYVIGIVVNYVLLLQLLALQGMAVNYDYLYWFQRQFASGFGAIPIKFPGNGLFLIATAMVIATAGVWMGMLLRDKVATYMHDTKLTHMYVSVVYFGVTTVLGLSYYLNRSYMSFQGSSAYITLFVAVFALYNLILYVQSSVERQSKVSPHNFVMRFLVAVPLSIALTHTYIPREIPQYTFGSQITNAAYEPVLSTLKEYTDEIHGSGFSLAYGGDFGHVVELYLDIPAVSLFNAVADTTMSTAANDSYCGKFLSYRQYDVIMVSGMSRSFILPDEMCKGMRLLYSETTQVNVFVREDFVAQNPDKWRKLQLIMSR